MEIYSDDRIVMTLDAGGTNFVFSALQNGMAIVDPINLQSNAHDLTQCLKAIILGFTRVKEQLAQEPVAISFAFPGPADYRKGIIGNLPNLPCFRGGVAIGPMLQDYFNLPVFISNDGDLFTYGEAMAGAVPTINKALRGRGVKKQYHNLLGVTIGTGFGGGMVINDKLCEGDNSAAAEIWLTRNFKNTNLISEEGASIRAVQNGYFTHSGGENGVELSPKDIYEIAIGTKKGNKEAAIRTFDEMACVIAESLANAITLLDGLIVIGGGISGAYSLLAPKIVELMNGKIENSQGEKFPRLVSKVYNLEDPKALDAFLEYKMEEIKVPFSERVIEYSPEKRIGIACSRLGTSKAIALGAYALALEKLSTVECF